MNHSSNRSNNTERPCGFAALLPLGMSCRGRAEAFARSLQSRLRTLGTQSNESTPITTAATANSGADNPWLSSNSYASAGSNVTNHQPVASNNALNDLTDSYFDFDLPGSPTDESVYSRLIIAPDTSTTTPLENASESGYVCSSPLSSADNNNITNDYSDSSSTDDPFFDPESSDNEQRSLSLSADYYDCDSHQPQQHHQQPQSHNNNNKGIEYQIQSSTSDSNGLASNETDALQSRTESSDTPVIEPNNQVAIAVECTISNSISTNDENGQSSTVDVPEIPKYDPRSPKDSLNVAHFVNGNLSEEEEEPTPKERFRRSSSLKTGKTPPGTPGRKKIVRFADVLGLDLADVRTFLDEIPRVPKSAFDELVITVKDTPISLGQRLDKIIVPLFQQPGVSPNFLDIVQLQNVALENAAVTDPICLTITGLVRVRNLDFNKSVHIRYTLDAWASYSDLQAEYVPSSCDGFSDKFSFTVFGNSMEIGQRIEIAIRFSCKGEQFWDNNHGVNYCFQCMPATAPQLQTTNGLGQNECPENNQHANLNDSWCGSFY